MKKFANFVIPANMVSMVRLLFVSDRESKIEQYVGVFSTTGYEFAAYSDETLIAEFVKAAPPDIVLFDTHMPKSLYKLFKQDIIILPVSDDTDADLLIETVNKNMRVKHSLDALAGKNKDLAESLYRLNVLYDTSSKFAGTLEKDKLITYMIEALDKSLSFSLCMVLSMDNVLWINSVYDLSDELLEKLKPLMEAPPDVKVIKTIKNPTKKFSFELLEYDNMQTPITVGDECFGRIDLFRKTPFTPEDTASFQNTANQVSLPLHGAMLHQEILENNKKLERLERIKSEFVSIVSHELRTPLTSVKNSLDILLGSGVNGRKCQSAEAEKFLLMARRNVERLGGIINDLLDLSKIEAGKIDYKFTNINIHPVIEYVKSTFSETARNKNIQLNVCEDDNLPQICADSQRLEQVLSNLVSNAMKFTSEGKSVTIRASAVNADDICMPECFAGSVKALKGEYVLVCVEDEGIGLAEEDFVKVFDNFTQIENSLSRNAGGSGLGLPIARRLVEAHSGAIWCESRLNTGSRFCFAIPAAKSCM